jgi:hypothetical protein
MSVVLKSFPDMGRYFQAMRIEDEILALYPDNNSFLFALHRSIQSKRPTAETLATIVEHYYDAPEETIDAVGEGILLRILEVLKK